MEEFKKDNNIMSGKGENDIDWITVKGSHIPLKDGQTPKEAIQQHFENQTTKKDAVKHLDTPYKKTELVKKIRNFEPIKLRIGDREILAQFDKDGAKKIVFGKSESKTKFETFQDHKTKLKNIDNLPEYIRTSKYQSSAVEDGKTIDSHKGVKEWHYFVNEVEINSKSYDVFIDVRDKGDNQFVYFVRFKSK